MAKQRRTSRRPHYGANSPPAIIAVVDGAICRACGKRVDGPIWGATFCETCVQQGKVSEYFQHKEND